LGALRVEKEGPQTQTKIPMTGGKKNIWKGRTRVGKEKMMGKT